MHAAGVLLITALCVAGETRPVQAEVAVSLRAPEAGWLGSAAQEQAEVPRTVAGQAVLNANGRVVRARISDEPLIVIDGGPAPFVRIVGAALLPDGLVIADAVTRLLYFYRLDGSQVAATGGAGDGPGEFRSLTWIQVRGDRVVVYDRDLQRLSEFDADGRLRGSTQIEPTRHWTAEMARGVFDDGQILVRAQPTDGVPMQRDGSSRPELVLLLFDARGRVTDSVASHLGTEMTVQSLPGGRGQVMGAVPFGKGTGVAVGPSTFYIAENRDDRIVERNQRGEPIRELRPPDAPRPKAVTERHIAAVRTTMAEQGAPPPVLALFDEMPRPDRFPVYGWYFGDDVHELELLRADQEGRVWVLHGGGPGDLPVWTMFSADGRPPMRIEAPEVLDVLAMSDDFVVVRHWSPLDVESVQLRALVRP